MINIPRKTLHIELYVQKYGRTDNFTPKRDKALNTSQKKVRNDGIVI